ncbi:TIGR00341 family protein [Thiorhodovibrio frisius]|uniref:TIGR00341 family protein n=1 Tax=Thiorhodovibrio frisius TaxID=631362 RepID=H8Z5G4_9GAMM|nr:TIGR00341 family protein [Thiorhodovibrio frisius]EIC19510.1 TIGR00341 family protein [Thiorhodovibrio frisius]WPL20527.1 putative hydrophobic domain protein [Thiorhodovibrio frisius]
MRIVEVVAPARHAKELMAMARFYGAADCWWGAEGPDGRQALRMLVPDQARQKLLDGLQSLLEKESTGRIVIQTVNATLPRVAAGDEESAENKRSSVANTREELYTEIAKGAQLDGNFLLLVALSTVVAAIGMTEDNVAVVVGAMVIAPLLGPIIAFAFATSLGDRQLSAQALTASSVGLGLALLLALLIGLVSPIDINSQEIMARTEVGLDSVALALASGAAAVLSLTTGLSSALVGVMVAVALLPPTAVIGLLLGHQRWELALGAALLLAVNVVCVLLSAKVVFLIKGVKPRGWLQTRKAQTSMTLYIALWAILLAVLIAAMLIRGSLGDLLQHVPL